MEQEIEKLYGKDDVVAYQTLKKLEVIALDSNILYPYFDTFIQMLNCTKTHVRVRGFRLICCLAKWDTQQLIEKNIIVILNQLDDDVSTSVRQCLIAFQKVLEFKPNLKNITEEKIKMLNLEKYKESMRSLIKRDITNLLK